MSIVSTQDSAVNTPVVPDAETTIEYQRYFWIRNPHASDSVNGDRVYTWNTNSTNTGTLKKWEPLNLIPIDESITNAQLAGSISADKLAGSIGISKLNLTNAIGDEHIGSITPNVITGLSGTNTGDQTLSIDGTTLTISGANGNSVSIPTVEAQNLVWDQDTRTLSITDGNSVEITSVAIMNNVGGVTGPSIPNDRYQAWYTDGGTSGNAPKNTWKQVTFSGVSDAQQPIFTAPSDGDFLIFGQIGLATNFEFNYELGLARVDVTANNATPADKTHTMRYYSWMNTGAQFFFHLSGVTAGHKYRLCFRGLDLANNWTSGENFPVVPDNAQQSYVRYSSYSFTDYNYWDSNITWMKGLKVV